MPKASRVGKFRQTALAAKTAIAPAPSKEPLEAVDDGAIDEAGLSRGQKKRLAKREQYLRKERLVMGSLLLKKQEEQAKRIDGLDAMKAALMATTTQQGDKEAKAAQPVQNFLKSQKARQTLLQRESNQLQLVMQHPAFKADPLATIREHLTNKLATQAQERQREMVQHEREQREAHKTAPKRTRHKKHRSRPTRSKA